MGKGGGKGGMKRGSINIQQKTAYQNRQQKVFTNWINNKLADRQEIKPITDLFTDLTEDLAYFISLEDEYYVASDQSIQVAMAVSQRIAGALQDALPDDAEATEMGETIKALRASDSARQRGEVYDPPTFYSDAGR